MIRLRELFRRGGGPVQTLLALLLVLQLLAGTAGASADSVANGGKDAEWKDAMVRAAALLKAGEPVSDWSAVALSAAGQIYDTAAYFAEVEKELEEREGSFRLVTDYQRIALGLMAAGYDPRDAAGYDLIASIYNHERLTNQGVNGPAYALIVLDRGSYSTPEGALWNRSALVDWIVAQQRDDGGWGLTRELGGSIDATAIALTALAPYTVDERVNSAIEAALAWLSGRQLEDGGFSELNRNSESTSQVMVALTSLGLDPLDGRFVKAQGDLLSHLLSFRQPDGGFAHGTDGRTNGMATEQALLALAAYERHALGLPPVYAPGSSIVQPDGDAAGKQPEHEREATLPSGDEGADHEANSPALPAGQAEVLVRIEGPTGTLGAAATEADNVLDALEDVLQQLGAAYRITSASFGSYVSAIGGVEAGRYGGFDGWMFSVVRDGAWIYPSVGMGDFSLLPSDEVVVYYSGDATRLVHSVEADAGLLSGQAGSVAVRKSGWSWSEGAEVVEPASGVLVRIGGQTKVTDAKGIARFDPLEPGRHEAIVTGYLDGSAPYVVRHPVQLDAGHSGAVVHAAVEGPEQPIAHGPTRGATALDALEQLLSAEGVDYRVTAASFGRYISAIGGVEAGVYGGFDGWLYSVRRGDAWVYPSVGMDEFQLEDGDQLYVYYGGSETRLIHSLETSPAIPAAGEAIRIQVWQSEWSWADQREIRTPAAGAAVLVNGVLHAAGEDGVVRLADGLPNGRHPVEVTGYSEGQAPLVVRSLHSLDIAQEGAVRVTVRAEGPEGSLAAGPAAGATALEGLLQLLESSSVEAVVPTSSFGSYVSAIAGYEAGLYGGYDGWLFSVKRGGEWIYPTIGMADFLLEAGDELVVYYGGSSTWLLHGVEAVHGPVRSRQPFALRVTRSRWDWSAGLEVVLPAAGVRVEVGGLTGLTDEEGIVHFDRGLPAGQHRTQVTGYSQDQEPLIVKHEQVLTVVLQPELLRFHRPAAVPLP